MALAYLSPLSRLVVGDLVMQAKLSRKSDSSDEFLDAFVELLMLEWNGQLAEKYQKAGARDRRSSACNLISAAGTTLHIMTGNGGV